MFILVFLVPIILFTCGLIASGVRVFMDAFRHPERDYSVGRLWRYKSR